MSFNNGMNTAAAFVVTVLLLCVGFPILGFAAMVLGPPAIHYILQFLGIAE